MIHAVRSFLEDLEEKHAPSAQALLRAGQESLLPTNCTERLMANVDGCI